jgi:hypothetical protein
MLQRPHPFSFFADLDEELADVILQRCYALVVPENALDEEAGVVRETTIPADKIAPKPPSAG